MKKNVLVICVLLIPSIGWCAGYLYPEKIEISLDCMIPTEVQRKIEERYSEPDAGRGGVAVAYPVDLNADGLCEIFLDNPSIYEGNGNSFTTILIAKGGKYADSGSLQWGPESWWYGELYNGYPRILVSTYTGPRSDPVHVTDVYHFNGDKYVKEFDSEISHGRYMEQALSAYREKDYVSAEKQYLNAFRVRGERYLADANNLALVWIRQGKHQNAEALLLKLIKSSGNKKDMASAYYNLGLIAEARDDMQLAYKHFIRSNELAPSRARKEKVERLSKLVVNQGAAPSSGAP